MEPLPNRNYIDLPRAERVEEAHKIIENLTSHPDIVAAMSARGYASAGPLVTQGQALYAEAHATSNTQTDAQGDKKGATQAVNSTYTDAYDAYQEIAGIARAAFADDPATLDALGVGDFPDRQALRLERFQQFSRAAREPAPLAALALYNVTTTDLDAFDPLVSAYEDALHAASATRGGAQASTEDRDDDVEALDDWILKMQAVARAVLRSRPQLLELLGLRIPS